MQISKHDSTLGKRGMESRRAIAESTGKAVYYYIDRSNGRHVQVERERRCPLCRGPWLLSEPLVGCFDFQCDRCGLVSNFAWIVR